MPSHSLTDPLLGYSWPHRTNFCIGGKPFPFLYRRNFIQIAIVVIDLVTLIYCILGVLGLKPRSTIFTGILCDGP